MFQGFKNPCLTFNGGCEDKCQLDIKGAIECSCHNKRVLLPDKQRCIENIVTTKCSSNEFTCSSIDCIPFEYTCDGTPHCQDGSDEDKNYCGKLLN